MQGGQKILSIIFFLIENRSVRFVLNQSCYDDMYGDYITIDIFGTFKFMYKMFYTALKLQYILQCSYISNWLIRINVKLYIRQMLT